jgi:hypothetical protein
VVGLQGNRAPGDRSTTPGLPREAVDGRD